MLVTESKSHVKDSWCIEVTACKCEVVLFHHIFISYLRGPLHKIDVLLCLNHGQDLKSEEICEKYYD